MFSLCSILLQGDFFSFSVLLTFRLTFGIIFLRHNFIFSCTGVGFLLRKHTLPFPILVYEIKLCRNNGVVVFCAPLRRCIFYVKNKRKGV